MLHTLPCKEHPTDCCSSSMSFVTKRTSQGVTMQALFYGRGGVVSAGLEP